MRWLLAGTLGAAATASAAASNVWFEGEWCDGQGDERLIIDAYGIGFNEHTVCEWVEGRPRGEAFDTAVLCANVYMNGDEVVRMDERTVRIAARRSDEPVFTVTVEGSTPSRFGPCE